MQRFFDFAAVLGILVKGTKENISPKDLQKVLEQVENKPEEVVINTMLLKYATSEILRRQLRTLWVGC